MMFQATLHADLYDCFTFFNELELLKIRFEEIYDVVDHFVVVEATQTFSGNPKSLYFAENVDQFEKYKDKIIHVVVNDFPLPTSDVANDRWVREEFQRNAILRGLVGCNNEDIILISDLDEIPNQRSIYEIRNFFELHGFYPAATKQRVSEDAALKKENQLVCELHMRLFLFYLNQESAHAWNGAVKAAPYWLVEKRSPWNLKILHMHDANLPKIYHAGWHFHAMGGRARVDYKLESIDPCMGVDEFINWTNGVYKPFSVQIDQSYPKYIQDNVGFYRSIGWIFYTQDDSKVGPSANF
jgi:beta-1,4-mannosyl-glycoprotein beta-1,4-N-acetylglucosaminyltransferase